MPPNDILTPPSPEDLMTNYEKMDWHYGQEPIPFWVIYENHVYQFVELKEHNQIKICGPSIIQPLATACTGFFTDKKKGFIETSSEPVRVKNP